VDGRSCRPGGPKRANDALGTGEVNNCRFYDIGSLAILPDKEVQALHPAMSVPQRRKAELLWPYEPPYWQRLGDNPPPASQPFTALHLGRFEGVATGRALHILYELRNTRLRDWMTRRVLPESGPELAHMHSQGFCSAQWLHHFAPGAGESAYCLADTDDPLCVRFLSLANELSHLLSSLLPADPSGTSSWGSPRAAEGVQISFGSSRNWHPDLVHLGHLILTVTVDGHCRIGIRGKDVDGELWLPQHPDALYAIWANSLAPTEHCVKVASDQPPRLSLTFRYVLGAPAAAPANDDGSRMFQIGDRVRAFYERRHTLFHGEIIGIPRAGHFDIRYDDGDRERDLPLKFVLPEVTPEEAARHLAASTRAARGKQRRVV
jgi:hypothetical protein